MDTSDPPLQAKSEGALVLLYHVAKPRPSLRWFIGSPSGFSPVAKPTPFVGKLKLDSKSRLSPYPLPPFSKVFLRSLPLGIFFQASLRVAHPGGGHVRIGSIEGQAPLRPTEAFRLSATAKQRKDRCVLCCRSYCSGLVWVSGSSGSSRAK